MQPIYIWGVAVVLWAAFFIWYTNLGGPLTPEEIEGRALLLGALFNGLTALSVRQPDMAQRVGVMAPVMRRMLKVLLAP